MRIEIFPADVEVTTSFYERLGFQVAGRNDGPPRYSSIRLGAVRIGVCQADPARRTYPAMSEIVIDVDDVHATRDPIVEQGIEPTEDLQERDWGLTDFRVTDPDGYYLRFTGRRLLTGPNSVSRGGDSDT